MKTQIKLIAFVAVAAIVAGAAFGVLRRAQTLQARFVALRGANFSTADLRGRVVLVNFWATSCTTCVAEMPKLVAAWNKYAPRGYETVAVAMSYDHPNAVAQFAQARSPRPRDAAQHILSVTARAWGSARQPPKPVRKRTSGVLGVL